MISAEIAWVIAIGILALYEAWALLTGHITLSRFVWMADASEYGALLPFLVGILCGHFFWSGRHLK